MKDALTVSRSTKHKQKMQHAKEHLRVLQRLQDRIDKVKIESSLLLEAGGALALAFNKQHSPKLDKMN